MSDLRLVPLSLAAANEFVEGHHRHSKRSQGHKFSIGLGHIEDPVGVAIAGIPRSRRLHEADPFMMEIYRVCVPSMDAPANACSRLYGACCRAGGAMGYERFISYTEDGEDGASLKAAGFRLVAEVKAQSWDRAARQRTDKHELVKRYRWQR